MHNKQRVAFVATGDELTQGEIANTDGQAIAQQLTDLGYCVGTHMIVTDNEDDIYQALQFLGQQYNIIIVTGGLGPTTDDRTRHAVARAAGQTLVFDESSWQTIKDRFQQAQVKIHESNKQQAYFPQGATIFANPNGTAPGFKVSLADNSIYVLPGPPKECLPMFNEDVLPELQENLSLSKCHQFRWRLFGVGESTIATQLDPLIDDARLETSYRVHYPYLDFKLRTPTDVDSHDLRAKIDEVVSPFVITKADEIASERLIHLLQSTERHIIIDDRATFGALSHRLIKPSTIQQISFQGEPYLQSEDSIYFRIEGLTAYWQGDKSKQEQSFTLSRLHQQQQNSQKFTVPYRHIKIMDYVVELLCHEIAQQIENQ